MFFFKTNAKLTPNKARYDKGDKLTVDYTIEFTLQGREAFKNLPSNKKLIIVNSRFLTKFDGVYLPSSDYDISSSTHNWETPIEVNSEFFTFKA